jgi:hypothetical protein
MKKTKNKYSNWYFKIIENAVSKNRKKGVEYYEQHHIIPRSIGGNNSKENLVLLTAREHYICHWLLVKFTDGNDKKNMTYAFRGMNNQKNKHQKRYVNSYGYEYSRNEFNKINTGKAHASFGKKTPIEKRKEQSERLKGNKNPFYGKRHSEETKKKISEKNSKPRPKTSGKNNPMYGRTPHNYIDIQINEVVNVILNNNEIKMIELSKFFDVGESTMLKKIHNFGYKGINELKQKVINEKNK